MRITAHFSLSEMTSTDGVPYPVSAIDHEDPEGRSWWASRLLPLFQMLEVIRAEAGGAGLSITKNGGYRDKAHQARIVEKHGGADPGAVGTVDGSQHPKGRAADIRHATLSALELHALILRLYRDGKLPHLGGLGLYAGFVHVDVRPRPASGHLAQWGTVRSGAA